MGVMLFFIPNQPLKAKGDLLKIRMEKRYYSCPPQKSWIIYIRLLKL